VGPRASFHDVERRKILHLLGLEVRTLGRPARSQLVYRMPYVSPCSYVVPMDMSRNMKSGLITEHEREIPKVNLWCTLPTDSVIGPYFFFFFFFFRKAL
jgi:hypothetical protein